MTRPSDGSTLLIDCPTGTRVSSPEPWAARLLGAAAAGAAVGGVFLAGKAGIVTVEAAAADATAAAIAVPEDDASGSQ